MELTAVIRALEALQARCVVAVHTDSQYVKNGIETWIHAMEEERLEDRRPEARQERRAVARARRARRAARREMALGQGSQRPSGQRARRRARQPRRRAFHERVARTLEASRAAGRCLDRTECALSDWTSARSVIFPAAARTPASPFPPACRPVWRRPRCRCDTRRALRRRGRPRRAPCRRASTRR